MTTKIKSGVISDNAITSAHISSGAISSAHLSSIDTDAVSEGSSNLYFTTARARTSFSITDSGGDGSLAYDNSTGVITYTGPSASEVRAHISVTDSGGDGSLAYSNGVITYTGPSASEVRAHLSAGTGVTYSGGEISIGQSVATTASPTFADINITGDLNLTGDINSYSVTDLDIVDQTITLGVGQNEAASDGSGIVIAGSSASILWDEPNDEFDINKGINVTGNIVVSGTVDGVDIATRDAILTSTTTTAGAALPKAGGTMTGSLTSNSLIKTTGAIEIASAQPRLLLDRGDGSYSWNIYNGDGTGNFPLSTFNIANNGGTAVITALDNGNVGIGTTSPRYLLEARADIDSFVMKIENDGNSPGTSGASYADASDGLWVDTRWNTATNTPFKVTSNSGNTPMMIIKGNGNVGIGTESPAKNLEIFGSGSESGILVKNDTNTNYRGIYFGAIESDNASYGKIHMVPQTGELNITSGYSGWGGFTTFDTNGSERMSITSSGIVRIGASGGTGQRLSINGHAQSDTISEANAWLIAEANGGDGIAIGTKQSTPYATWIQSCYLNNLGTSNNYALSFNPLGGNVGIGTDNPSFPLHISSSSTDVAKFQTSGSYAYTRFQNSSKTWALSVGSSFSFYDEAASATRMVIDSSGNLLLGGASSNDSSSSMGAQTPNLYVPGYTSLGGLRIKGTDTGNTIYKTGGPFGLTLGDTNIITLSNSDSTARLNSGNWEVLSGGQLRAYRSGNSAYGALFMDTGENLFIRNSWGVKDIVFNRDGKVLIGDSASHTDDLLQIETPASGGGHGIQIRRNDSNSDQGIGHIQFGNNTDTDLARISAKTDGSTDNAALIFSTQPNGGTLTERMRIREDGLTVFPSGFASTPKSYEKAMARGFSHGVANQKCDLVLGTEFWGNLEVSVTGTFSNQNMAGVLKRSYALGLNSSGTVYTNKSRTIQEEGVTANNFAIGEVEYDSTLGRYKITIAHRVSTSNTLEVKIKAHIASDNQDYLEGLQNAYLTDVYTTNTTVYKKQTRESACHVYHTAGQSISATPVALSFTSTMYDPGDCFSGSEYTAPEDGVYSFAVTYLVYPHVNGITTMSWQKYSGGAWSQYGSGVQNGWSGGSHTLHSYPTIIPLAKGEKVRAMLAIGGFTGSPTMYGSQNAFIAHKI